MSSTPNTKADLQHAQPKRSRRALWAGLALLAALGTWLFLGWLTVAVATAPLRRTVVPHAELDGVALEEVETTTADGLLVRGWFGVQPGRRVVLLFAGKGGDRAPNLGKAKYYLQRGWSVLMPALRATGDSAGERVGMGYAERLDVRAWVAFAKQRGFADIALHGQSLGAAAVVYSFEPGCDKYSFIVLESCYDDVRHALVNRLSFVPLPGLSLKPVEWFGASALGVPLDELRPVDRLPSASFPLLMIAGDADPHALPSETQLLFDSSGAVTRQLSWIEGGVHEDLWSHDAASYTAALGRFFTELDAIAAAKGQW